MADVIADLKATLSLDSSDWTIAIQKAQIEVAQLKTSIDKTGDSVQRIEGHLTSAATGFRRFVITLGAVRFIMMDIQDVFLSLPSAVMKTSGEIERMTKLMEGLSLAATDSGRKIEAMKNTQFVFDMALRSPFEVKALQDSFVKLKTGGIDPTNGSLQALIDSVAKFGGTSEQLKRASIAIQQMGGKGVVSMEELRQQLGEAVPNAIQMMSTGMDLTMSKLVKAISKGTVEAQSALGKMFAVMALENQGAAEAMMNTWNGALAQLATRWELYKKDIGDAGFADAMVGAVKELNKLMASPEGKQFAVELGQTFAAFVRWLVDAANWLKENTALLKGLAGVLVSVFAIAPIVNWANTIRKGLVELYTASSNYYKKKIVDQAAELQKDREAHLARQAMLKDEIVANEAHYRFLLAQRERYLMDALALEQRYSPNKQGRMIDKNTGRPAYFGDVQKNQQQIQELRNLAQATMDQANSVAILNAGNRQGAIEAGNLAQKTAELAQKKLGAATATKVLTAALTGLRWIGTLIGGWIGAISLALTFGIPLWMQYANAAENAMKRVRNAVNSGSSTQETIDENEKLLKKAKDDLKSAEERLRVLNASSKRGKYDLITSEENNIAKLTARIMELESTLSLARTQVAKRSQEEAAQVWKERADAEIAAIRENSKREANEILKQAEAKNVTEEQVLAIRRQANQKRLDGELKVIELMRRQRDDAQRKMNDAAEGRAKDEATAAFNRSVEVLQEQEQRIKQIQEQLGSKNRFVGGNDKKDKSGTSPIENFIKGRRRENAELAAKIEQFSDESVSLNDLFEIAVEKVKEMEQQGLLKAKNADGTLRDAAPGEVASAVWEEYLNRRLKAAQTGIKRMNDIVSQARADLKQYEERIDADPALIGLTKGSDAITALINKMLPNMEVIDTELRENGKTWKSWAEMVSAATMAAGQSDILRWLEEGKKEIQQINAELKQAGSGSKFEKEREKADERIRQAEVQAKRLIEIESQRVDEEGNLQAAAAANIERIEQNLAARVKAIRDKLAYDTRTPMQKMAEEWVNLTERMQEAQARWVDDFVNRFVDGLAEGKFAFKDFATAILKEITKLMMQKVVGQFIMSFAGALGGGTGGNAGLYQSAYGLGADMNAFGGISGPMGKFTLEKYARGGVVPPRTPHVAIFGEGSQSEAYVPLPDGRRIPVAMQGGGQPNVQVNVINQTGVQADAKTSTRFDGKQMVLDVILTSVTSPGPFRDGMRQALR